ncbi:hypothetical protein [Cellulomonas sp. NTE-D12]|uniref:hypothetical protein n=1 Tax=Cellulomonas sp. NTE-D12 TaxID=2962632 RepID=UPI003081CC9E|nr:hypothetical protein CELD12_14180 [Cellulomonas sp. NTE-D12]
MPDLPPIDVDRALTTLGLLATGGTGTAGGWLARRPEDESPAFELLVLMAAVDERLVDRVDRFAELEHPHLGQVRAVTPIDPGRTGVLVDHVVGVSLGAIRRARAPMTDGECVTLLVPLCQALSALGTVGLAHGAVEADNVVVQPDGRPVLVAPRPGLVGTALPGDDLPRLLSTVVGVMPEEDGALLAGPASVPRLRPVLDQLLAGGCSADEVVARCFATAEPEAVRLPDAAALAGASLVAGVRRPFPVSAGTERRPLPSQSGTTRTARRRRPAARSAWRRASVAVAAGVLLVVAVGIGRHGLADPPTADTSTAREPLLDRSDPAGAAAELTRRRADVLRSGSADRVADVAVTDGPAARADSEVIASLGAGGAEGLSARVDSASVTGTPTRDEADVSVSSATSGYVVVSADGRRSTAAAAAPRTVLLHLRWTAAGWRVWSVSQPGAAP